MQKRLSVLIVAGLAVSLAGCAGDRTGASPPPAVPNSQVSAVKAAVLKGCGYVPTIASVAAILTASPYAPAIGAVAEAICQAVSTLPFADGPGGRKPVVHVNGRDIVVDGYFARPPRRR